MNGYILALFSGLLISFTGTLPLGNLNLAAMHLSAREGHKRAAWFSLGVTLTEMLYLSITLRGINWVLQNQRLFQLLQWVAVVFLLLLAIASFVSLRKKEGQTKNVLIENKANRFLLGAGMGLINPIQFPFWAGWAAYAITQRWVVTNNFGYNLFTLGAGIGGFIALCIFIYAGKKFSKFMNEHQRQVQWGMGFLFTGMALYQIIKIF